MAEVYKTIKGMSWEAAFARQVDVKAHVRAVTLTAGNIARADLATNHRASGKAKVVTGFDEVNGYVALDDTADELAAMSIEFGRGPGTKKGDRFANGTRATWILHKATGLAGKVVRPNSRRTKRYLSGEERRG